VEAVVGSSITWLRLTPVDVKSSVTDPIAVPLYYAVYRSNEGFYRVYLSGWDGEVILMEKPAGRLERGLWLVGRDYCLWCNWCSSIYSTSILG
jgi:hypothetical protein